MDVTDLERFERLVLGDQQVIPAAHYDAAYFTEDWRDGHNDYRVETRRRIEGKHPQLLKDVFGPERVLDVGCGPGALMYLLWELGVTAEGVDFAPSCRELAPPEVRDQITIASIVDEPVFPERSYDLVICREVMEHLTVLQVRKLVSHLCQISSKYVYVTTRFHPNPASLLDVTDEREVDPSHITLLNQDFLRVLFVLEGFKRRPDLEAQIDWLGKQRVLIYERQA
jgi:SAM-dependent methyltransferase